MTEMEASVPSRAISRGRFGSVLAVVEVAALVLLIGAGLATWGVGIGRRGYDYDEVQRAHSIWLAGQGLRPYVDFFECHPPYFRLLTPVVRRYADPADALRALRLVAGVGNLLFLGALFALGVMSAGPSFGRRWAWLGVAVVAFHPYMVDFLVEFRIDGWGYALAAWSIVLYRRRARGVYRAFEFGLISALAAALFCPKLVLLPPLIVLFDQVTGWKSRGDLCRTGAAYLVGVGLAAGLFVLYLWGNGIGLGPTSQLLGRYHTLSNANAGFRHGLLRQLVALQPLISLVGAGAACWVVECLRRKTLSSPYEPALAVWLVAQALLVAYPYKQYYAPWFLFGSAFVPFLGLLLPKRFPVIRTVVFLVASVSMVHSSYEMARIWADAGVAPDEDRLIRWMNRVARPEDHVAGALPFHPIARRDTFFLWFNTTDPNGFDSERILSFLPRYRTFITDEHYRAELEAHPPAFAVLRSPAFSVGYPKRQASALSDFLAQRGYLTVRVGDVWFALRPDRFEYARRNGLLE